MTELQVSVEFMLCTFFLFSEVTCRSLGYKDGLPVCCSAYGFISYKYRFSRFQCDGSESSLEKCTNETVRFSSVETTACRHASVVCLQEESSQGRTSLFMNICTCIRNINQILLRSLKYKLLLQSASKQCLIFCSESRPFLVVKL